MPIVEQEKWDSWVEKNTDSYGKCCVDVARDVMTELDKGEKFDCHDVICKSKHADGITGFMAGAIASMVSQVHSRGDEFKKQWNSGYGVKEESKGVVNPALVTIEVDDAKETK